MFRSRPIKNVLHARELVQRRVPCEQGRCQHRPIYIKQSVI